MKKSTILLSVCSLFLITSCNKNIGGQPENSWTVNKRVYNVAKTDISASNNNIISNDGEGSNISFSFLLLPAANIDLNTNTTALTNQDIAIRTILGGNIVYNSIPGGFVSVRVDKGKYTLIANNLKFVNASSPKDTAIISTYIVEK